MTPRLLDLFCGAGGAAVGYYRAGFADITGIDNRPMPRYPFKFIQADALEYLAEHGREYDVIHASPPCQKYTGLRRLTESRYGSCKTEPPDLIATTRKLLIESGKIYVIENVQNSPLQTQLIICGASLGLNGLSRHRHFESNLLLMQTSKCSCHKNELTIGVYGSRPDGRRVSQKVGKLGRSAKSLAEASSVMGIDWMTWKELTQAIPPAYTEWIGKQIMPLFSKESEG